jgi:hypothetical protein
MLDFELYLFILNILIFDEKFFNWMILAVSLLADSQPVPPSEHSFPLPLWVVQSACANNSEYR